MNEKLKNKVTSILSMDSPENYLCWEDAEESILSDLSDNEAEEYLREGCSTIEEWYSANKGD
jgi:hypothetical protein